MQRFRDIPINRKLSAVILLTCTAVLLVAGGAMIGTEIVTSRRALVKSMVLLSDVLARSSNAALSFHRPEDAEEVQKNLAALTIDPQIVWAHFYDMDNIRFSGYLRAGETGPIPDHAPPDGESFTSGYLDIIRPVEIDQQRVGTIYLRSDLSRMYGQVMLYALIVGLILITVIVVMIAISPRLQKPISDPILALASVARGVARDKDYSARAEKISNDEIGLLTDAFNQMMREIETAQTSLQGANDELARAKDVAENANKAKDQFLAALSHELRTPLTPVLLTISLLQTRKDLPEDLQEAFQTIQRHVELEARLIDDLLDLTRITRGKLQLNFLPTDAHKLIRDAIQICCSHRTEDVTLKLDAQEHFVRADPARLMQIFWNLFNNANKFTPVGRRITVTSTNPAPGFIRVEVADQGIGIQPGELTRIFNPFEQADASLNRAFGGLGLGLTIAKALVVAHGGSINVASPGKDRGTTFTVDLAAIDAPFHKPDPRDAPPPPTVKAESLSLLLVEDHEVTLRVMARLLKEAGHHVHAARNVKEALAIVAKGTIIDLVISDLGLPDGTGYDLMATLRDQYALKGICLSGFGMEDDIARGEAAGFCQHLIKPVDLVRLQEAIQYAINLPPTQKC